MKSSRIFTFHSSSPTTTTTTTTITHQNDQTTPPSDHHTAIAAAKIQSAYRAHAIRALHKKIAAVEIAADELERTIQRQDTVDLVRSDKRERARLNESLMRLLLELDSIPGRDSSVREARRNLSHRVVELQEILDSVADANLDRWSSGGDGDSYFWGVEEIEEQICRERGGNELEAFCYHHLGFRCLHRFLSQP